MKINFKTLVVIALVSTLGVFSGCKDEDPNPGSSQKVTSPPSDIKLIFASNSEAELTFTPLGISQTNFKLQMVDEFDNEQEFVDIESSPYTVTGFSKGRIYKVAMAGGNSTSIGDYGDGMEPVLASARVDENSMVRIDMLNAINEARATARICGTKQMAAVPPLNWDDKLNEAAEIHTTDMNVNNFFDHTSKTDNSTPGSRVTKLGYSWNSVGENIHKGSSTAQAAVASWLTSPPHCENIMSPNFEEVGAANEGIYWTQVFGRSN